MINYTIKATGEIFARKTATKRLLDETMEEAGEFALREVRSHTPVRTGLLQSGWTVTPKRFSLDLNNPVFYAPYVEKRFRMIPQTRPKVVAFMRENLSRKIKGVG